MAQSQQACGTFYIHVSTGHILEAMSQCVCFTCNGLCPPAAASSPTPGWSPLMSCHCRSSSPCVFLLPAGLLSGGSLPTELTPMGCGLGSLASVPALSLSQGSMGRQRPAGGSLGSGGFGMQQRQPSGSGGGGMQRQPSGGSWGMGGGGDPPVGPLASWGGGQRGSKRARSQCSGDGDEAVQRAAVRAVHTHVTLPVSSKSMPAFSMPMHPHN